VTDLVGKTLKDFRVLRRLGRGAMAEVYLAQQLSLGRQVALKVLDAELACDPNYVRRFHLEARAAAALVHSGIVQIYEVGHENGVHYIAQEYVSGRNLGEVIRSQGSLATSLALDILRQVAAALAKASGQGIVHRDIKPENIMLARSGEVKVADFGLARVEGEGVNLTQIGVTMGTPLYMSPEQIEGRQIDSRSDIYSLGITAYHMLHGKPPFSGDTPLAVAVQHLNEPPPPLTGDGDTEHSRLTAGLGRIIERMIAKKPADRYSDPAALLAELNSLTTERSSESWGTRPTESSLSEILHANDERNAATSQLDQLMKTLVTSRTKRWPMRWIALSALACALLGGAVAAFTRPNPLLAGAHAGPPRSDTVWGQIYHAKTVDTEEAWLAVIRYFPDAGAYYHHLARQGLVYYYLTRTVNHDRALQPLQELAASAQKSLQAFGVAGLVVAYAALGEDERAYYANQQLSTEMRDRLEGEAPRMAALLNESIDDLADRAF
jgi:eukaryotic-like serine/threonine-protein kinase